MPEGYLLIQDGKQESYVFPRRAVLINLLVPLFEKTSLVSNGLCDHGDFLKNFSPRSRGSSSDSNAFLDPKFVVKLLEHAKVAIVKGGSPVSKRLYIPSLFQKMCLTTTLENPLCLLFEFEDFVPLSLQSLIFVALIGMSQVTIDDEDLLSQQFMRLNFSNNGTNYFVDVIATSRSIEFRVLSSVHVISFCIRFYWLNLRIRTVSFRCSSACRKLSRHQFPIRFTEFLFPVNVDSRT